MIRNRIALKLALYFAIALLVFSFIIGGVFSVLFKNYTMDLHQAELEKRAARIAQTLSEFMPVSGNGRQGGYGMYLRFINDIAMTDVWIVDQNLNLVTARQGMAGMGSDYVYADLPADADRVISEVFTGQTAFSEDFSPLLNTPTLTVGTPIMTADGEVIGVVLLHSPVEGINQAVADGFTMLAISILTALLLASLLSILFSISFTRPLNRMRNTALLLAEGDYTAQTRIRQNDELGELAVALDILSDRLELASQDRVRLEQLRRDFVTNISHELRTPITVIRGSLEALYDGVVTDPEQVKSYQEQIMFETRFLQRLVGELLDLSTLQNTDFAIENQEINMAEIIDDVTRSIGHIARDKGIRIEAVRDESLEHIRGDYGRLRQMLMILLDNAVKFSPENGVVKLILKDRSLSVIDNGAGIEAKNLPYIFDRFYKARSEQNKSGTGLGLAIAKQIADRHDISISVESEPHIKTEFKLKF
ncbi:phosphate regulon sensor protein phor (sphs) [hydrocarbon metagenome]|uniref:histidine kinase n=1 Tax=hydrocarbon metagenome TaxID=938273 RepID=A0A0W8E5Z5_9ZZZZ